MVAYRNATQDVLWSSSAPGVAAVANEHDVRSRVDGVSPGIASVYATDPQTGAVAGPATFEVQNDGAEAISEFELLDGERIVGEVENLAPGLSGRFSVTLEPGRSHTMRAVIRVK